MILENVDGFSFDFPDAIELFVFDEKDGSKPTYHGMPMKAVDVIVELETAYLFVEIKDFEDPAAYDARLFDDEEELRRKRDAFKWLKRYLVYKFRDSYLYRYAEGKVNKPIHYICLLTFENALNSIMLKTLRKELPTGRASKRWKRELAASCQVVNVDQWNRNFPKWPVHRVAGKDE